MRREEYKSFVELMTGVAMTFDQVLKPQQVAIYFEVLKGEFETIEDFKISVINLLKSWSYNYMPKPAHFIQAGKMGDDELEAMANETFEEIREAIRDGAGYTKEIKIDCPLTSYALNTIGGVDELLRATFDEMKWLKRDFIKFYKIGYRTKRLNISKRPNRILLRDLKESIKIENRLPESELKGISYRVKESLNSNNKIDRSLLEKSLKGV